MSPRRSSTARSTGSCGRRPLRTKGGRLARGQLRAGLKLWRRPSWLTVSRGFQPGGSKPRTKQTADFLTTPPPFELFSGRLEASPHWQAGCLPPRPLGPALSVRPVGSHRFRPATDGKSFCGRSESAGHRFCDVPPTAAPCGSILRSRWARRWSGWFPSRSRATTRWAGPGWWRTAR